MMRFSKFCALSFLATGISLFAQGPGFPPHPGFGEHRGPMEMGRHSGKVVAGAPYSATTNNSVMQMLPDGNSISRVTAGQVARDSQGRTYSQQNITGGPWAQGGSVTITFISDPVAGYTYILNSNTKTAYRRPFKEHSGEPPLPPPASSNAAKDRVETNLGEQTISGVNATGKSITRTIPAGQIGNAQAIVDRTEIWIDPQLQIVVKSTRSDPRTGQSTYTLTNIQQTEPNAALFQLPAGYAVKDAPNRGLQQ